MLGGGDGQVYRPGLRARRRPLRRDALGQPAQEIAEAAGVRRDQPIRVLVLPLALDQVDGPLGREKLAPLLSLFSVDGAEQGWLKRLLAHQAPATAVIHRRPVAPAALRRGGPGQPHPGQRPATHGCIGVGNGLTPSLTLGCGTFGGNSTTDNVTYTNLLNIKRLARPSSDPCPGVARSQCGPGRLVDVRTCVDRTMGEPT